MIKDSHPKVAEVLIVGAGPAGLAAAMQLRRYGLNPLVFERAKVGGLLWNANLVENYPGFPAGLPGPALTPYLVGLLVMLGMLGTFLGMVVTLTLQVLVMSLVFLGVIRLYGGSVSSALFKALLLTLAEVLSGNGAKDRCNKLLHECMVTATEVFTKAEEKALNFKAARLLLILGLYFNDQQTINSYYNFFLEQGKKQTFI